MGCLGVAPDLIEVEALRGVAVIRGGQGGVGLAAGDQFGGGRLGVCGLHGEHLGTSCPETQGHLIPANAKHVPGLRLWPTSRQSDSVERQLSRVASVSSVDCAAQFERDAGEDHIGVGAGDVAEGDYEMVREEGATFPLLVGVEFYSQSRTLAECVDDLFSLHAGHEARSLDAGNEILTVLPWGAGASFGVHPQNIQL